MTLFDCAINEKCCSVDGGRGICPLFSPSKAKKLLMPGGQSGGGRVLGAGGIDWCINPRDEVDGIIQQY